MLTCAQIVALVTDYEEGRLDELDRQRFEEHVAICPPCRAYLDQMRRTVRVVGDLREDDVPPELEETLVEAFRAWKPEPRK